VENKVIFVLTDKISNMKKISTLAIICFAFSTEFKAQSLPVKSTSSSVVFETVTSGINEVSLENSIKVFPNPASNQLMVVSTEGYVLNSCELFVYDVTGKVVMHEKNVSFKDGNLHVDVSDLNNGVYTLVLNPKNNKVAINKRFVVSK
jgi:hypothetical protein